MLFTEKAALKTTDLFIYLITVMAVDRWHSAIVPAQWNTRP